MRAIKFSARLGFTIEKKTLAAMRRRHSCILTASTPRVCEEIFRLFTYSRSEIAFRQLWECGMMGDLLPELAAYVERSGGRKSPQWRYLAALDAYDEMMRGKDLEVSNGLRAAVLMAGFYREAGDGSGRKVMQTMLNALKIPKATYFEAVLLLESTRRMSQEPTKGKMRFIHNRDFLDILDFNRVLCRAEARDERALNQWCDLYEQKGKQ